MSMEFSTSETSGAKAFFISIMKNYFVIMVFSIVVILVGLLLAAQDDMPSSWRAIGGVLATLAGIAISWIVSAEFSRNSLAEEQANQMAQIGGYLGIEASHIQYAVDCYRSEIEPPETVIPRIQQSATNLNVIIANIQKLSGRTFETENVIVTRNRIMELTVGLTERFSQVAGAKDRPLTKQEIEEVISSTVTEIIDSKQPVANSAPEVVTVQCIECGAANHVALGLASGATATVTCNKCMQRFHVHRKAAGVVDTNRYGGSSSIARGKSVVTCSVCESSWQVDYVVGSAEVRQRYCIECGTRLLIDLSTGEVLQFTEAKPQTGTLREVEGERDVVVCDVCGRASSPFWRDYAKQEAYAECFSCQCLLVAPTMFRYAAPLIDNGTEVRAAGARSLEP